MAKQLILTRHAQIRAESRAIRSEWIEDAARHPDWVELEPRDSRVERRFRVIEGFGSRILRVVCVETQTAIRVISVMFDRDARRKP